MLYDVFICHASEDKAAFVGPLAAALQSENVAVWYDEFSLKLGDSIRRSLDKGLKQSRFGVVVLSHAFFNKNWPQYELDGLAEREMKGRDKVLLPIWHGVSHADVMEYSPALAGRKAVSTDGGLGVVVDAILEVVHPQQSPLIVARDALLEMGLTPPVITDQYWLEVVEASNRIPGFGASVPDESSWDRWSFPLPEKEDNANAWGERLAWTAMQLNWVKTADKTPISPLTRPEIVLQFIDNHPGLFAACQTFPSLTAEYAPQLTILGMGGDLEPVFEEQYQKSNESHEAMRRANSPCGSALTTNSACPLCDVEWAFRHPRLGDYEPVHVAQEYFNGGVFGPRVSPYYGMDHAVWLLSAASDWLPQKIHDILLEGTANWISWSWGFGGGSDNGGDWESSGALLKHILECREKKTRFTWTERARDDALHRIELAVETLSLPESPEVLFKSFIQHKFPQNFIVADRNLRRRRSGRYRRIGAASKKTDKSMGSDLE